MSSAEPPGPSAPGPSVAGLTRCQGVAQMLRPRVTRAQLVVAGLVGLLGFALVTQVHTNSQARGLAGVRSADLVGILGDLTARGERLRGEISDLTRARDALASGTNRTEVALTEARQRAATLGILAGTLPATGPGITLSIADPQGRVPADVLVDALEELRNAGAEAIQLGPIRVGASTWVGGSPGQLLADGQPLVAPYRFRVIGDPRTLEAALGIPGGVLDTVAQQGGTPTLTSGTVTIRVLRTPWTPRYARPAPTSGAPGGG